MSPPCNNLHLLFPILLLILSHGGGGGRGRHVAHAAPIPCPNILNVTVRARPPYIMCLHVWNGEDWDHPGIPLRVSEHCAWGERTAGTIWASPCG